MQQTRTQRTSRLAALAAGALTVALLLLLPGTRAHADGPTATIFGFIAVDSHGALPIKVRALGPTPLDGSAAVCGTAEVFPSGDSAGFYLLSVASSDARAGCPAPGGQVRFLLLYGAVDPGLAAQQVATWSMTTQQVDLSPVAETVQIGAFNGTLPSGPGFALLAWQGPDGTPVEQAIVTIPREVQVVFRLDARSVERYVVNAPSWVNDLRVLNTGDFVAVLVK